MSESTQGGASAPAAEGAASQQPQETQSQQTPQQQPQAKSNKKAFDLKVNNEIKKLELDLDNQEELTKYLQKAMAFDTKAQEAASMRKQIEDISNYLSEAKGNPAAIRKLISELGGDEKALAQAIMEEEIERSKKSPEQLEHEKLLQELNSEKKEREKLVQEKLEMQKQQQLNEETTKIESEMMEALDSNAIPKNPYFIKKLAEYGMLAAKQGIDISFKELVPLVKKELRNDLKDLFELSGDDFIEELLTKDRIANIRKRQLAEARQIVPKADIKDAGSSSTGKKEVSEKIPLKKFLYG